MSNEKLGRVTASRTDATWGSPARVVKNWSWFAGQAYETAVLSTGHQTDRQWYVYDAASLIIKGTCDYDTIANVVVAEGFQPVKSPDGHAIVALWINLIKDAVCGAYHEIVISVDVTSDKKGAVAPFGSGAESVGYLYNYFAAPPTQFAFLHTLFINSPLSIAWGREMQAFPKHPKPVKSLLNDNQDQFTFDLKWDDNLVLRGHVAKQWGVSAFAFQALNLIRHFGLGAVTQFLTQADVPVPIQMPRKTALQYACKRDYLGQIHKGLNPTAIRTWPWSSRDELVLGDVHHPTGSEENNGHLLLKKGGFQPKISIYMPFLQAYVK